MTAVAVQRIDRDTGEITMTAPFDFPAYLAGVGKEGLTRQQQLAAAYDTAVAALIGPNDVQVEGARTFKKKSAWRKLARHFGISTVVRVVDKEWDGPADLFVATVTVQAIAPWGQSAEAVGACGTDEETGRRTITVADAIATAETRATNRAISNLIAMGEVSAEEMNKERGPATRATDTRSPADKVMPFGKSKGTRLGAMDVADLRSTVAWCKEKDADKFKDLIAACTSVLAQQTAVTQGAAEAFDDDDPGSELPF